uniref:Calpain_III domain-containing protein n=1 Tax=Schistocephalus solidus TaxID=70667 RepID=A0A183SI11_SCHSO
LIRQKSTMMRLWKRALISGALKAIGLNEKQSILDNIGAHELPTWVYFPDVERAEWLNKSLYSIPGYPPNVALYYRLHCSTNCQWLLAGISSTFYLPTNRPGIGGVKVYTEESIRRDEIVMDVDVMFVLSAPGSPSLKGFTVTDYGNWAGL